jgi:hypothetical protein
MRLMFNKPLAKVSLALEKTDSGETDTSQNHDPFIS